MYGAGIGEDGCLHLRADRGRAHPPNLVRRPRRTGRRIGYQDRWTGVDDAAGVGGRRRSESSTPPARPGPPPPRAQRPQPSTGKHVRRKPSTSATAATTPAVRTIQRNGGAKPAPGPTESTTTPRCPTVSDSTKPRPGDCADASTARWLPMPTTRRPAAPTPRCSSREMSRT